MQGYIFKLSLLLKMTLMKIQIGRTKTQNLFRELDNMPMPREVKNETREIQREYENMVRKVENECREVEEMTRELKSEALQDI